MQPKAIKRVFAALVGLTLVAATSAHGVINIQNLGASARSAALGNSFVAVADNADAVFANPAGLVSFLSGESGMAKLRPDHSLFVKRGWDIDARRIKGAADLAKNLARIAAEAA